MLNKSKPLLLKPIDRIEEINTLLERLNEISDKKTLDIIKEHITIKDNTYNLDLSSTCLSPEEQINISYKFLHVL